MTATYPKTRSTATTLFGIGIPKAATVAGAAMYPALLVTVTAGAITALGLDAGVSWKGDITSPNFYLGQGYSGVHAADILDVDNQLTPVGSSQNYITVDTKTDVVGWLKIGDTVAENGLLYATTAGLLTVTAGAGEPVSEEVGGQGVYQANDVSAEADEVCSDDRGAQGEGTADV